MMKERISKACFLAGSKRKKIILGLGGLGLLLVGLAIGVKQVGERQEMRTRAAALPQYQQIGESQGEIGAGEAGEAGANEAEIGKWIIPSINGFGSDAFTGTASLSYPIQLPAGINGVQPNLSFHYSSSTIDDSRIREKSLDWQLMHKVQANYTGLGWRLGGMGYITKDRSVYPHAYYLVFPGGSAKLLQKNDGEWETSPKLFAKIYHRINFHHEYRDTNHWEIITKDGTHYIFGDQIDGNGKPEKWNPAEHLNQSATGMIIVNKVGTVVGENRLEANKWQLARVFDVHANDLKIYYQQETERYGAGQPHSYYTRAVRPTHLEYGYNQEKNKYQYRIEFSYQDREDDKVLGGDSQFYQSFWTKKLLKEINIFAYNDLLRKYILTHEYTPEIQGGHPDLSNKHAILTKIEHQGRGGQGGLPAYIFTYDSLSNLGGGSYKLGDIYLMTANNGYGGKVTYEYDWLNSVSYYNRNNEKRNDDQTTSRARLKQKIIEDGNNNSYLEIYDYGDINPVAYVKEGAGWGDKNGEYKGFEYLGHSKVKVKLSEKNNHNQIISQSRSFFHQYLAEDNCFRVDPRKGISFQSETLSSNGDILTKAKKQFGVEINGQVFENPVCANIPGATWAEEAESQFFVFNRRTDNFLTDAPGVQKRTASSNLEYNFVFGDLEKSVQYGEVDFVTGADLNTNDNKYSFIKYAPPNLTDWIVSKPEHTYLSDTIDALIKYQDSYLVYNDKGLVVQAKIKDESTGFEAISRIEYNNYGLPIKAWDARNGLTETVYDNEFPNLPIKNIVYLDNSQQLITQIEYDYVLGLPTKTIDVNEQESRVEYDHYGRVLALYGPIDSADQPSKIYQYFDPLPHVQIASKVFEAGELDAISHYNYSRQIMNGLGQTIQTQALNTIIENEDKDLLTTTEYNSRGQMIKQTQSQATAPKNETLSRFYEIDWSQAIRTETNYDDLGRPVLNKSIIPSDPALNSESRSSYRGFYSQNQVQKQGNQFVWGAEWKDGFGRTLMSAVCLDNSYPENCPENQQLRTHFAYNFLDQIAESWTEQPGGQTTPKAINRYDRLGRKKGFDNPDLGAWSFGYDKSNNLISQVDSKSQEIRFEYDALNRMTKKIYPNNEEIVFEYDQGQYGLGKQTKMIDLTGFTETKYNQVGLPAWSKKQINAEISGSSDQSVVTENEYYISGLVKEIIQPDSERINYQYNRVGQMTGVSGDQEYLRSVSYNRFGAVSQQVLGNQIQINTRHDDLGRMTQLGDLQYKFDLLGNIKTWENEITPEKNISFEYDPLSRVLGASGFYEAEYQYDSFGRMGLKKEGEEQLTIDYSGQEPFHAPKRVAEYQYQYDANGNLLDDGEREYVWNYDNKPLEIKDKETGTITYFAYDGAGERVLRKVVAGEEPTPTPIPYPDLINAYGTNLSEADFNADGLVNGLDFGFLTLPEFE